HASHLEGRESEGRAPIDALEAYATQDQFVYRHAWRKGDVLMWDNGSLLHRGADNFNVEVQPRVLHRTVLSNLNAELKLALAS
ncbi:MAG: TauD/TfdA family dioxygenase, partial [Alphaproteobacteria bacterium]|nr:TauD/TfdA family dioxygenase [Alphaproteobacteria bacterium]